MFKKVLALILCTMMLAGCAVAESEWAFTFTVDEINFTGVRLNPSLDVTVGSDGANYWMEPRVVNGATTVGLQMELSDAILISTDGAQDVLAVDASRQFALYGLDPSILTPVEMTDEDLAMLESGEWMDYLFENVSVPGLGLERIDNHSFRVNYVENEFSFSARVSLNLAGSKTFDLSGKNRVDVDLNATTLPDSDVITVVSQGIVSLMADPSVQELIALFSDTTSAAVA